MTPHQFHLIVAILLLINGAIWYLLAEFQRANKRQSFIATIIAYFSCTLALAGIISA